jgi:hypothetical protein
MAPLIRTTTITKLVVQFDIAQIQKDINSLLSSVPDPWATRSLIYRDGHYEDRWTDGAGSSLTFDQHGQPARKPNGDYIRSFVEEEFVHLNPEIRDTYLGEVYRTLQKTYPLSRYRLACLKPKTSYSWHSDEEMRIHIPVYTTPGAFLITEDGYATHLPSDGSAYMFDARGYHTAVNADRVHCRYHLLLNINP